MESRGRRTSDEYEDREKRDSGQASAKVVRLGRFVERNMRKGRLESGGMIGA